MKWRENVKSIIGRGGEEEKEEQEEKKALEAGGTSKMGVGLKEAPMEGLKPSCEI